MGTIVFPDPNDNEEKIWGRDDENPDYRVVREFLNQPQRAFALLTKSVTESPVEGLFVPTSCSLHLCPAIHLKKIEPKGGAPHGTIIAYQTVVGSAYLRSLKGVLPLQQNWARLLGDDLIIDAVATEDLEFAVWNYLKRTGHDPECRSRPLLRYAPDDERIKFLKIALNWQHWEHEKVKWDARAWEVIDSGIVHSMSEDNLRRICKKAGLLKPSPRSKPVFRHK